MPILSSHLPPGSILVLAAHKKMADGQVEKTPTVEGRSFLLIFESYGLSV